MTEARSVLTPRRDAWFLWLVGLFDGLALALILFLAWRFGLVSWP